MSNLLITSLVQKTTTPSTASGTVLTKGVAAFAYGAWGELLAITTAPVTIVALVMSSQSSFGADTTFDVEIGLGAAGEEETISRYRFLFINVNSSLNIFPLEVPLSGIPAGARLVVRMTTDSVSAEGMSIAANYYENFDATHHSAVAAASAPSDAIGVTVSPPASAWGNSNWVELLSNGLSSANVLLGLSAYMHLGGSNIEYDLGSGEPGLETVISTLKSYSTALAWGHLSLFAPYPVGPITRIAVRQRQSDTSGTTSIVSLRYLGPLSVYDPTFNNGEVTVGLTWVEVDESDGSTRVSSKVALPDPEFYHFGYKQDTVMRWGRVRRALSLWDGNYETSDFKWEESDTSRTIRGLLAGTTTKFFPNRPVRTYMISDPDRRALIEPQLIFHGILREHKPVSQLFFEFTAKDQFAENFSTTNSSNQIPQRLITTEDFPNCNVTTATNGVDTVTITPAQGLAVPIIYGAITDYHVEGGVDFGDGQCPLIYVGERIISGTSWGEFLICGHACYFDPTTGSPIIGVYVDNDAVNLGSADLLVPGYTWPFATNYLDYNGRRYTAIFAKGTYREKFLGLDTTGSGVPMCVNVYGIENVGNGSGSLITNLADQYLHCLQNFMLNNYASGAWFSTPTFPDDATLEVIDEGSFQIVRDLAETRVPGGPRGDFIIGLNGERWTAREILAQFNQALDCDSGFNFQSQYFVSMIDTNSDTIETNDPINDVTDVFSGTFDIEDRVREMWNAIPYRHTRDYLGRMSGNSTAPTAQQGDWRSTMQGFEITDADSIANYTNGEKSYSPTVEFHMIRGKNRPSDADDYVQGTLWVRNVLENRLNRTKAPPRYVSFEMGPAGFNYELGDIFALTHYEGIGASGWTARLMRVIRHEIDPEQYITRLECLDLGRIVDPVDSPATGGGAADGNSTGIGNSASLETFLAQLRRRVDSKKRGGTRKWPPLPPSLL